MSLSGHYQGSTWWYRTIRYRVPFLAYCVYIFWQSSHTVPNILPSIEYLDKLLHAGGYAVLGVLSARALKNELPQLNSVWLFALALMVSALFGISDEIHQSFVPGRTADIYDALVDAVGSGAGALFYIRYVRYARFAPVDREVGP